jgi:hypothetical protein
MRPSPNRGLNQVQRHLVRIGLGQVGFDLAAWFFSHLRTAIRAMHWTRRLCNNLANRLDVLLHIAPTKLSFFNHGALKWPLLPVLLSLTSKIFNPFMIR